MYLNTKKLNILKDAAKAYLIARKDFKIIADETPELRGNDNLIGRIGEFIAIQFLKQGLNREIVQRNKNIVEAGYDIEADGQKVSVKIITNENKAGRNTRVRNPWDELVLIELNGCKVLRIGHLKKKRLAKSHPNANPVATRTMLNVNGLIGRHGKVYSGKDVERYL